MLAHDFEIDPLASVWGKLQHRLRQIHYDWAVVSMHCKLVSGLTYDLPETHIGSLAPIEPLEIADELSLWPNFL